MDAHFEYLAEGAGKRPASVEGGPVVLPNQAEILRLIAQEWFYRQHPEATHTVRVEVMDQLVGFQPNMLGRYAAFCGVCVETPEFHVWENPEAIDDPQMPIVDLYITTVLTFRVMIGQCERCGCIHVAQLPPTVPQAGPPNHPNCRCE